MAVAPRGEARLINQRLCMARRPSAHAAFFDTAQSTSLSYWSAPISAAPRRFSFQSCSADYVPAARATCSSLSTAPTVTLKALSTKPWPAGPAAWSASNAFRSAFPCAWSPMLAKHWGRSARHWQATRSRRLRLIGITGTNGKTTTTHLIASMLQAAGHRTGLLGTLGYHDAAESAPADLTTPDAVLAEWLGRMVANNCSHAVMEVSSHALAQRRIAGVEFARVGLTNLWCAIIWTFTARSLPITMPKPSCSIICPAAAWP